MTERNSTIGAEALIPDGTTVVSIHERGYARTATEEETEPVLKRAGGAGSFVLVPFSDAEGPQKEIPIHGHGASGAVRFWGQIYLGEIEKFPV